MHAHAQPNTRIVFQQPAHFQRALHRFLQTLEKDQRHPVTGWNGNELPIGLARLELCGFPYQLIELLHDLTLLIDEKFRITNYVNEQDVRDLEMKMRFLDVRHSVPYFI